MHELAGDVVRNLNEFILSKASFDWSEFFQFIWIEHREYGPLLVHLNLDFHFAIYTSDYGVRGIVTVGEIVGVLLAASSIVSVAWPEV